MFEIVGNNDYHNLETGVNIITEENAAGKRIDILIEGGFWTIVIENKIWSNVNNPLETYKERMEQYDTAKNYSIVLTLHEIKNKGELKKIEKTVLLSSCITIFLKS